MISYHGFAKCYNLGNLDKVYKKSISYNCRWVYNDLNKKI